MADQTTTSMKLLIDPTGKRILFAEASKDCVDFFFHILSLPISTVIRLLGKNGMMGSVANLYQSLENLHESYIQPNQTKDSVLKPVGQLSDSLFPLLLLGESNICNTFSSYNGYDSEDDYGYPLDCNVRESGGGGLVKDVVTYMVMDDLVVTPMSTISSITLLNKFNVKDVGAVKERVVKLGNAEAVMLLQASLQTKNVLTHVFLNGNK